jgi:hypothetical protein
VELQGQPARSSVEIASLVSARALTGDVEINNAEFNGFASIAGLDATNIIDTTDGGKFDLSGKSTALFVMTALSNAGTTLIGDSAANEILTASATGTDTDTLTAGNGTGDLLEAGGGIDTLNGGTGGDTFEALNGLAAGSVVNGAGTKTNNMLEAGGDISGAQISNIGTLAVANFGNITLNAAELAGFSKVTGTSGGSTIFAATAGNYTLPVGSSSASMTALASGGTTLKETGATGVFLTASASGNDTLTSTGGSFNTLTAQGSTGADMLNAGGDTGDTLIAGNGADTLIAGVGDGLIDGGPGYDKYQFGANIGQHILNNDGTGAANGEIDFTAANSRQFWFEQQGSSLLIDQLGTSNSLTVGGWFDSTDPGAQVTGIHATDAAMVNTQVAQLVQAMATFQANNPAFNPVTATQMPSDANLQAVLAASWH